MPFIEKTDFPATIHADILDAVTRQNDDVITENVSRTVDEMKAYLNGRYDITAIFNKTGEDRNQYMLRIGCAITLYWICSTHNPRKMTQVIADNYKWAIDTLEGIQKGDINPDGLPVPAVDDPEANSGNGAPIQWGSTPAQDNSW